MKIFITNLGRYNEGYLVGKWVKLPVCEDVLDKVLKEIGIDEYYEEYFITDYENEIIGIGDVISEYHQIIRSKCFIIPVEKRYYSSFFHFFLRNHLKSPKKIENCQYSGDRGLFRKRKTQLCPLKGLAGKKTLYPELSAKVIVYYVCFA